MLAPRCVIARPTWSRAAGNGLYSSGDRNGWSNRVRFPSSCWHLVAAPLEFRGGGVVQLPIAESAPRLPDRRDQIVGEHR